MKKLVSSKTFKFLIGTLVFLLPGGAIMVIAATMYKRSTQRAPEAQRSTEAA